MACCNRTLVLQLCCELLILRSMASTSHSWLPLVLSGLSPSTRPQTALDVLSAASSRTLRTDIPSSTSPMQQVGSRLDGLFTLCCQSRITNIAPSGIDRVRETVEEAQPNVLVSSPRPKGTQARHLTRSAVHSIHVDARRGSADHCRCQRDRA